MPLKFEAYAPWRWLTLSLPVCATNEEMRFTPGATRSTYGPRFEKRGDLIERIARRHGDHVFAHGEIVQLTVVARGAHDRDARSNRRVGRGEQARFVHRGERAVDDARAHARGVANALRRVAHVDEAERRGARRPAHAHAA